MADRAARWALILALLLASTAACAPAAHPAGTRTSPSQAGAPAGSVTASPAPVPARSPARASNPRLRAELLAMLAADQAARTGDGQGGVGDDQARTERLAAIIDRHGWPTRTLVGVDGATAAWAVAQHSDLDPEFQRRALALMTAAAATGEADRGELAYLTDRVAANAGTPQTYGTQMGCTDDGSPRPADVSDPAQLDRRRAEAGLPPMADYLAEMTEVCAGSR
jgi:hypothetical protein